MTTTTHQAHYETKVQNDRALAILEAKKDQADINNIREYEAFRQYLAVFLAFLAGAAASGYLYHYLAL